LLLGLLAAGCSPVAKPVATWTDPTTGMVFIHVPAGSFDMGTPPSEVGREAQERLHRVHLTRSFYLGRTEVTQAQWIAVMGSNPSAFADCGGDCPLENANLHAVEEFIGRLSKLSGVQYRLPTEAEWEYACRAGTRTPFSTGKNLTTDQSNYAGDFPYPGYPPGIDRGQPTPVGTFAPNPWDFHDLHGNVWEWVRDEHCSYPEGPATDPKAKCGTELRVIRGGSWAFNADSARCGLRYTHRPQDKGHSLGFRVAADAPLEPSTR
jgi:formylglycine-generating enzyme required for sulfatase activity